MSRRIRVHAAPSRPWAWLAALAVACAMAGAAHGAPATLAWPAGAPPTARFQAASADSDTSLDDFIGGMADSTDQYFGVTAAPTDTAGLDSALAYGLDHPEEQLEHRRAKIHPEPRLDFNRVDGAVYGGALVLGDKNALGELTGTATYANGPNVWLGFGTYQKVFTQRTARWTARIDGGTQTYSMDRDYFERYLAALRAFISGRDHKHYLRQEGVRVAFQRESEFTRVTFMFRDMLEKPLETVATWNLMNRPLDIVDNLQAEYGRAVEVGLGVGGRLPLLPVNAEAMYLTSDSRLGGDLEYQRLRIAANGQWGVGRVATFVPQVLYGRLRGDALPQESFYIGGGRTLRSIQGGLRAGTGIAVARADLIGTPDILALAHIPHPDMFPIQASVFTGAGAVWGVDPFGPVRGGTNWPDAREWMSEVGFALSWTPGIPDPSHFIRLSYAAPLGPAREHTTWSISYSRALDLVRPFSLE